MDYTQYAFGDFSFIKSTYMREMLEEDFNIINNYNLWDALLNSNRATNIPLSNGHSGMTYSMCLSAFINIAKNGWGEYVKAYIEKNY